MSFEPVCSLDDLWEGEMVEVVVGGTTVLVVHAEGQVAAFASWCPHQQYPLVQGELEGRRLTCFAHRWEFDAVSGAGLNPDDCALSRYAVRVEDDQVFVDVSGMIPGTTGSLST